MLRRLEAMDGGALGLTVAAGAGKTTLAAAVCAAAVAGPLAQPRGTVIGVAGSFTQALILADYVQAFLRPVTDADPDRWRVLRSESAALVEDRKTGAQFRAREANARTLQRSAPSLIVADEPAQWMGTQAPALYSAIRSRLGKLPGSRLFAIGTRSADAAHWFSRLLERSCIVYAADSDADPFDAATWEAANPSLPHLPELRKVYEREAAEAGADPSLLPAFRALRCNMGAVDHEVAVLIEAAAWQRCEVDLLPAAAGPAVWGVDLSGGEAMAAARAFAVADVEPATTATRALTPAVLSLMARNLIRRGESLHLIEVDRGGVRLIPVVGVWDVRGRWDPVTWRYRADVFGPSGNVTRCVPAAGVIHARYSVDPARPWQGVSPLGWARLTGRLHANLEDALSDEAGGTRGHVLPVPQGPDGDEVDADGNPIDPLADLRADVQSLHGRTVLTETTSAGWGEGQMAAPAADWKPQRIGANPPRRLRPSAPIARKRYWPRAGCRRICSRPGTGLGSVRAGGASCTARCNPSRSCWPWSWPTSSTLPVSGLASTGCSLRTCPGGRGRSSRWWAAAWTLTTLGAWRLAGLSGAVR